MVTSRSHQHGRSCRAYHDLTIDPARLHDVKSKNYSLLSNPLNKESPFCFLILPLISLSIMPSSDHDSITQQPFGPMPEPSMHRTLSRSDSLLPQSESPNVAPINDYDRSLYKFPWLGSESCRNLEDEENLKGRDDPGCRQPTTSDLGICRDCDSEPSQAISPDGQDEAMTAKHRPGAGDYGNEDAEKEDPNLVRTIQILLRLLRLS